MFLLGNVLVRKTHGEPDVCIEIYIKFVALKTDSQNIVKVISIFKDTSSVFPKPFTCL